MSSSDGLDVIVWTPEGECENGVLMVELEGVSVRLENGKTLSSKTSKGLFYNLRSGQRGVENRILLDPVFVIHRPYQSGAVQVVEDVFPPSTGAFYGRMRSGKEEAVYIVQDIEGDSRKWLLIGDPKTGRVWEFHQIQDYEADAIEWLDGGEHQSRWDNSTSREDAELGKRELLGILDEAAPSWEAISHLLVDVTIPNLKIGESTRNTLSQFVPDSFPESVREQFMAFLAHIIKPEIEIEDPVEFSLRTDLIQIFRYLMRGHLRCIHSGSDWPPYIKYLQLAERSQLQQPIVTLDAQRETPWDIFRQKVNESFPNWTGLAVNSASELFNSSKVVTRIPVTASQAKKSRKAWRERLAAVSYGLKIRGHVNFSMIGLTELVYLGAAYRWPHRHMKFITRLGPRSDNPPHLQVMTMPQNAAERVKRVLPGVIEVAWSTRSVNYNLFSHDEGNWVVPVDQIVDSVNNQSSMRRLVNRFSRKSKLDTYGMSPEDAIVAGLVSRGIYLIDFEREGRFKYWGLSRKQIHSILSNLYKMGVVDTTYDIDDARFVSIATVAQGESEHITSLVESFLENTPTSLAMVNKESNMGILLSTLTEDSAYELVTKLPAAGIQKDLVIRCMRPTTFRSFTFDLYSRLLRKDSAWDDDVSAFLSQARSKRRELSESNA